VKNDLQRVKVEAPVLGKEVLDDLGLVVALIHFPIGQVTVGHPAIGHSGSFCNRSQWVIRRSKWVILQKVTVGHLEDTVGHPAKGHSGSACKQSIVATPAIAISAIQWIILQ
jgi:hypothetical protein